MEHHLQHARTFLTDTLTAVLIKKLLDNLCSNIGTSWIPSTLEVHTIWRDLNVSWECTCACPKEVSWKPELLLLNKLFSDTSEEFSLIKNVKTATRKGYQTNSLAVRQKGLWAWVIWFKGEKEREKKKSNGRKSTLPATTAFPNSPGAARQKTLGGRTQSNCPHVSSTSPWLPQGCCSSGR